MSNYYQISFDAMPSYQEKLNSEQNQFYQENQQYFANFTGYVSQSRAEAAKALNLTFATIGISIVATIISYIAIAKDQRLTRNLALLYSVLGALIAMVCVIIIPNDYAWLPVVAFFLFAIYMFYKLHRINKREERDFDAVSQYQI